MVTFACAAQAQAAERFELSDGDRGVFEAIAASTRARHAQDLPFAQLVQALATDPKMLGRAYAHSPLEGEATSESLYAGFTRFDCVTYVETVLAMAETLAAQQDDADRYPQAVSDLRYRDAKPAYCARLHYFSDWIRSNATQGRLAEVTREVGREPRNLTFLSLPQGLDFMSRHAARIPALASNPERQACVRDSERSLALALHDVATGDTGFEYIPLSRLADVASRLRGGDIVAFVAERQGLDVVHVGIVVEREGQLAFAHASQRYGRVAITPDFLRYAASVPSQRGIRVLRPLAPTLR